MRLDRRSLPPLAALLAAGCVPTPDSYPVPPQHTPVSAPPPVSESGSVSLDDVRAGAFFVKDVNCSPNGGWCWTGANPQMRFRLDGVRNRRAMVEFVINHRTFQDTGPLRVSFFVNGNLLAKMTYDQPGPATFEKPVPEDWLKADSDNDLLIRIENPWTAPDDGATLGILLKKAGLVQE